MALSSPSPVRSEYEQYDHVQQLIEVEGRLAEALDELMKMRNPKIILWEKLIYCTHRAFYNSTSMGTVEDTSGLFASELSLMNYLRTLLGAAKPLKGRLRRVSNTKLSQLDGVLISLEAREGLTDPESTPVGIVRNNRRKVAVIVDLADPSQVQSATRSSRPDLPRVLGFKGTVWVDTGVRDPVNATAARVTGLRRKA